MFSNIIIIIIIIMKDIYIAPFRHALILVIDVDLFLSYLILDAIDK